MKLHIQTIRCDHMQMLHTVMIRDYDACTAAHCSLLSKSVMQADRLLRMLHGGFKVLQLCRGCLGFAVSMQTLSGSVASSELCTHGEPFPTAHFLKVYSSSLWWEEEIRAERVMIDTWIFGQNMSTFWKSHGKKTWAQTSTVCVYFATLAFAFNESQDFVNCALLPDLLPQPPSLSLLPFPSFRQAAAQLRQHNTLITQLLNIAALADSGSKQNEWIMSCEPALWIPLPIVLLLWLFDLPYWNADDRPINNAKSRFPSGEAGREKHLAYRWKPAVSVPLSLWPRAALSFIGLNRQSIQQPCMKDEGMRQAVNDEEPKIKGLTPSQL